MLSFDEWKKIYFPASYEKEKIEKMTIEEKARYLADNAFKKILEKA